MIGDYIQIAVGDLYVTDKGFWTSGKTTDSGFDIKRFIKKGTIIEIRYPYAWHFRFGPASGIYDHAKPEVIKNKCSFFGRINKDIRFNNKHKLAEILKGNLYIPADEFKLIPRGKS